MSKVNLPLGGTAEVRRGTVCNLRDSGERNVFSTGAEREPETGRGRYDLISPIMLRRLAIHYENGAGKYAPRNWEKGLSVSRCINSCKRHIDGFIMGDKVEDHLAAAIWNIAAIMHYQEAIPSTNTDVHDLHPYYQSNVWPLPSVDEALTETKTVYFKKSVENTKPKRFIKWLRRIFSQKEKS